MNRNRKGSKRSFLIKTAAVTMGALLAAESAVAAFGAENVEKDENVYVTLAQDGTVSDVYVVNEFTSDQAGEVTDYGSYVSVKNLSTDSPITQDGNRLTMEVPKGKFYLNYSRQFDAPINNQEKCRDNCENRIYLSKNR